MKSMKSDSSTVKNWLSTPFELIALTLIHKLLVKFLLSMLQVRQIELVWKNRDWFKEYVIKITTRVKLYNFSDFELKTAELA